MPRCGTWRPSPSFGPNWSPSAGRLASTRRAYVKRRTRRLPRAARRGLHATKLLRCVTRYETR